MNTTQKVVVAVCVWLAILAALYLTSTMFGFDAGEDRARCPYKVLGSKNATLQITYFGNPFCIWCLIEEPILTRLVEQKGASFKLSYYDNRYCDAEVNKYGVAAVPFFVFSDGKRELKHPGYIAESDLRQVICESTGDCS